MRDKPLITTNKYGKRVFLPPQTGSKGIRQIKEILEDCEISYIEEYRIDAKGCRRSPFDIAVIDENNEPKLFIEYDGEDHYQRDFYKKTGVREERCIAHVAKTAIGEAKKEAIAAAHGIPVLRVNGIVRDDALRERLLAWIAVFAQHKDISLGNEIILIDLLEEYGLSFDYVPPSNMNRAEKERYEKYKKNNIKGD